jgi:hypothetical protein
LQHERAAKRAVSPANAMPKPDEDSIDAETNSALILIASRVRAALICFYYFQQ